jgi:hypothetical protein
MRVLVCGSRTWHRGDVIRRMLRQLPRGTIVMHGGARGADRMAGAVATQLGFPVEVYVAAWNRQDDGTYDRTAGFRRNIDMLDKQPDLVIAFHESNSTGTQHVIDETLKRGIQLLVVAA